MDLQREKVVFASLGALRVHLAEQHGLIPEGRHDFLWVTEFPLLEWDEDIPSFDVLEAEVRKALRYRTAVAGGA